MEFSNVTRPVIPGNKAEMTSFLTKEKWAKSKTKLKVGNTVHSIINSSTRNIKIAFI